MPTAIVYRTIKGWQYGIEGRGSHGAGHKFLFLLNSINSYLAFEDASALKMPVYVAKTNYRNLKKKNLGENFFGFFRFSFP